MLTADSIRQHLDRLTKPPGSLGRFEDLAFHLCRIQNTLKPKTKPRRLVLFAGDHGVVGSGVSAWPSEVTQLMVRNILAGGAASSVFARSTQTDLRIVDVGTLGPDFSAITGFANRKVRPSSRNLAYEPALTPDEFDQSLAIGADEAELARSEGSLVVAAGEMGIGNSTPAACLTALLANADVESCVGRGAGADDAVYARKLDIVSHAVDRVRPMLALYRKEAIASVCGFEIAAAAGFFIRASELGLTIVLDGAIVAAAALIAETMRPGTSRSMIAAHKSAEPGHGIALGKLGLEPMLDSWNMRLGEGTGALLLFPLLDAAAAMVARMATFESAGIANQSE